MSQSIDDNNKPRGRGRPRVDSTFIGVRVAPDPLDKIDDWRSKQRPIPSRPEAMRKLTSIGIEATPILKELLDFFERHGDPPDAETQGHIRRLKGIISE